MKLFIDLDDTLCTFAKPWCEWLHKNGHTTKELSTKDVITYDFITRYCGSGADQFYLSDPDHMYENVLNPLKDSREFFAWCNDNFDTHILSFAPTKVAQKAKTNFIQKHFKTDKVKFAIDLHDKCKFTKNSILLDDYPINIVNHIKENDCHGIVYNHNRENAWTKLVHYPQYEINRIVDIDVTKLWHTDNYEDTQFILERLR